MNIAKLSPVPASAWADMVLVPDNPGRPTIPNTGPYLEAINHFEPYLTKQFRSNNICPPMHIQSFMPPYFSDNLTNLDTL